MPGVFAMPDSSRLLAKSWINKPDTPWHWNVETLSRSLYICKEGQVRSVSRLFMRSKDSMSHIKVLKLNSFLLSVKRGLRFYLKWSRNNSCGLFCSLFCSSVFKTINNLYLIRTLDSRDLIRQEIWKCWFVSFCKMGCEIVNVVISVKSCDDWETLLEKVVPKKVFRSSKKSDLAFTIFNTLDCFGSHLSSHYDREFYCKNRDFLHIRTERKNVFKNLLMLSFFYPVQDVHFWSHHRVYSSNVDGQKRSLFGRCLFIFALVFGQISGTSGSKVA